MKIAARQCKICGDIVYSRARHDCRRCSCGAVFVDGGPNAEFGRVGGADHSAPVEIEVAATPTELYADWNYNVNDFGRIAGTPPPSEVIEPPGVV